MSAFRTLVVRLAVPLLVGTAFLAGHAAPPPGPVPAARANGLSEVVATDPNGHQLVGYGSVSRGQLTLRLDATASHFVLALVASDGTVETLVAHLAGDGTLLVELSDGTTEPLATYLEQQSITLRVEAAMTDASSGAPGKSAQAPGQSGEAPAAASNAQNSGHGSSSGSGSHGSSGGRGPSTAHSH